jgi:nucleotide sugar dehydrogenase
MVKTVCVIGVGFVGERLVNVFKKHYQVVALDVSIKRIEQLQKLHDDVQFMTSYEELHNVCCDAFLISVPTLVNSKTGNIDMSYLDCVRDKLRDIVTPGSLVMVESSVYVGATRELFAEFRNAGVFVGFSPERVDPGRKLPACEDIPKVIAGVDAESLSVCEAVYARVFKNVVKVSSTECAEMCKMYENCFRMVNIAYVNEIADMCDKHNINTKEMIKAASTKPFGFMPFTPGLGVGGHCIPVNPHYLFKNGSLPVLECATRLMATRPKRKAYELVARYNCSKVLLIGIGFKVGESLTTNSPGYALHTALKGITDTVVVYDPIVQNTYVGSDVSFLKRNLFDEHYIRDTFDLVIVNLPLQTATKRKVVNAYEQLGGVVHHV